MEGYLDEHALDAFGQVFRALCSLHPGILGGCPVFSPSRPIVIYSPHRDKGFSFDDYDSIEEIQSSQEDPIPEEDLCHSKRWNIREEGSSCIDYSSRGGRQMHTGESTKPFLVLVAEMIMTKPHVNVHEITVFGTADP